MYTFTVGRVIRLSPSPFTKRTDSLKSFSKITSYLHRNLENKQLVVHCDPEQMFSVASNFFLFASP